MSERAFHTTGYITPAQPISKDERALRRLLCAKYEHLPYMDDGEAHGQTLDWLRGSVEEIETRIREINIESFAAQSDAHMQMASPIFALAVQALNGVKAWRDCEGNDGFPDEVREQIDAVLSAFELRYTTHPITGEPMGTDAQEATAWRLKAENLERENAVLLMANATTASKEASMALTFDLIYASLKDENAALRTGGKPC